MYFKSYHIFFSLQSTFYIISLLIGSLSCFNFGLRNNYSDIAGRISEPQKQIKLIYIEKEELMRYNIKVVSALFVFSEKLYTLQ